MLDLGSVIETAGWRAVIADVHPRVLLGKLFYLRVQHLEHSRALSCVRCRIAGSDEGDAHRRVRHKEVVVDGLVASAGTCQRLQLVSHHAAHAHRVHLDQLWEHRTELTRQVFPVLLHLAYKVLTRQQRVEPCIDGRVDIGRQVFRQVVNTLRHQVFVQSVEHIADGLCRGVPQ